MTTLRPLTSPEPDVPRRLRRPWQVYAMVMLWAIKGFQELLSGVIGTSFFVAVQDAEGRLAGYALQTAFQSIFFSTLLAAGSFYVMAGIWLGKRAARPWGIVVALVSELTLLAYLITRPPEFGGTVPLVRTVITGSFVNLGIVGFLLFDGRLTAFLGSPPLTGWWSPRR
ncbi:MAG TPA: hypothetical protein VL503_06220 [Candidatus Omnitrophota bacterium]|jgi:hypothetical protein|nr:hypothetical protein [Candidatus Omnitrophota bacterium]